MIKAFKNPEVIAKIKQNTIKAMYRPDVQIKLRSPKTKETKKRKPYKPSSLESRQQQVKSRRSNGKPWHTEAYKKKMSLLYRSNPCLVCKIECPGLNNCGKRLGNDKGDKS